MEESLFAAGNIIITRTLAKFGTVTYPIANIGSVSAMPEPSGGPAFIVILGIVAGAFIGYAIHWLLGWLLFSVFCWLATKLPKKRRLVLKTSSGDINALVSEDFGLINDVKSAIEQAFTMR